MKKVFMTPEINISLFCADDAVITGSYTEKVRDELDVAGSNLTEIRFSDILIVK